MTLTQLRKDSGIKATKIAKELGISRTQLYNLEKGVNKLDKLKIEKLSYIYRVTEERIVQLMKEAKSWKD